MVWFLLLACGEAPAPPPPAPRPAAAPPKAPPAHPRPPTLPKEVPGAAPMRLATHGPGGTPMPTLNLVVASRGDGEIEPCG